MMGPLKASSDTAIGWPYAVQDRAERPDRCPNGENIISKTRHDRRLGLPLPDIGPRRGDGCWPSDAHPTSNNIDFSIKSIRFV
jgi:hypothetical protein